MASPPIQENNNNLPLLIRVMSKRRTWVCLFVSVYTVLLSLSWNLLKSVLSRYEIESTSSPSPSSALYASLLLGVAFGVLSMVAALAVAVPATLVTWITMLVLLTFCGKPRKDLVFEGKKLTAEISGFVVRVLIKEDPIVPIEAVTEQPVAAPESPVKDESPLEETTKAKKDAPAPKESKTKKVPAPKKRGPSAHPPYFEMIKDAITTLKDRTGSSQYAIRSSSRISIRICHLISRMFCWFS